jgi:hypothetical protein
MELTKDQWISIANSINICTEYVEVVFCDTCKKLVVSEISGDFTIECQECRQKACPYCKSDTFSSYYNNEDCDQHICDECLCD